MSKVKVAVVTGGGTGMGLACATELAGRGFAVQICGRREDVLQRAAESIVERVPAATVVARPADIADPRACEALIASAIDELGGVHALVTCAAMYEPVSFLDITAENWDATLNVVLRGSVLPAVAASRWMAGNGGGRIVLISSINGVVSEPDSAAYSAAKAAIISVARSIAMDLSDAGVTANAIISGWVHTAMTAEFLQTATRDSLKRLNMLGRVATPEELAGFVSYLLTDAPAYLTGAALTVDGGQTALAPMP
jgi:meso-butanediol dehydrogenase/(S,S)-butanediol dehydrogenase/diacetyl reductase